MGNKLQENVISFFLCVVMILILGFTMQPRIVEVEREVVVERVSQVVIPRVMENNQPRVWYTEEDIYFLTEALYFESRGESMDCQAQVGYTILNRKEKRGGTIKEVIWASKQFSYTHDGKHERMLDEDARQVAQSIAILVLNGYAKDRTMGGEYFYNPSIVDWVYKDSYTFTIDCGNHRFLR